MIKILTTISYEKKLLEFRKKHPEMRNKYIKTISLLTTNPYHPSLRLHKLKGDLSEFYSISLNLKYRILLDFIIID